MSTTKKKSSSSITASMQMKKSASSTLPMLNTAKSNRTSNINKNTIVEKTIKLWDAGGGEGRESLTFDVLQKSQKDMYKRTLELAPLLQFSNEQEVRQLKIVNEYFTVNITVAREDFPAITADIEVRYCHEAAQAAWAKMLVDIRVKLNLEFIECMIDRMDGSTVNRTQRLRNKGLYFVRQREASAILESIYTGKGPVQYIWPITKIINKVQDELKFEEKTFPKMENRVDYLVSLPLTRNEERIAMELMIKAPDAAEIINLCNDVMTSQEIIHEAVIDEVTGELIHPPITYGPDPRVDTISMHRLALESMNRLALRSTHDAGLVVKDGLDFIFDTLLKFRDIVDILIVGLSLICELSSHLALHRNRVYSCILDIIQEYAPEAPIHRPRVIKRFQLKLPEKKIAGAGGTGGTKKKVEELDDEEDDLSSIDSEDSANTKKTKELAKARKIAKNDIFRPKESVSISLDVEANSDETEEVPEVVVAPIKQVEKILTDDEKYGKLKPKKGWSGSKGIMGRKIDKEKHTREIAEINKRMNEEAMKITRKKLESNYKLPTLATCPGLTFRGFQDKGKTALILQHAFSCLYKIISQNVGNREVAFQIFLHEEIGDIALVCQGMPRVLEYIAWIINSMYSDGFGIEEIEDEKSDANTMILSNYSGLSVNESIPNYKKDHGHPKLNEDGEEIDPETGIVIDAVSVVTLPSVDYDNTFVDSTPRVNTGEDEDLNITLTVKEEIKKNKLAKELLDKYARGDAESNITDIGIVSLSNLLGAASNKAPDENIDEKYTKRPSDGLILAMSMIGGHGDINYAENEMSMKWVSVWDDGSREYRILQKKGLDLISL